MHFCFLRHLECGYTEMAAEQTNTEFFLLLCCTPVSSGCLWVQAEKYWRRKTEESHHRFGVISSSGSFPQSACYHLKKYIPQAATLCIPSRVFFLHRVGETGWSVLSLDPNWQFWGFLLRFIGLIWGKGSYVIPSSCREVETGSSQSSFLLLSLISLQAQLRIANVFLVAINFWVHFAHYRSELRAFWTLGQ